MSPKNVAFFLMSVVTLGCASLYVEIVQATPRAGDTNPIINFSEVRLLYNGIQQVLDSNDLIFGTVSSGYPPTKCTDDITATGTSSPYNMCKSGNDLVTQTFTIAPGRNSGPTSYIAFDKIELYNAYGFNNQAGQDVGLRAQGAILRVRDDANGNAVLFEQTLGTNCPLYSFTFPLTASPTTAPSGPTKSPTRAPTGPTQKPTIKPTTGSRRVLSEATDDLAPGRAVTGAGLRGNVAAVPRVKD